jgi:ubiquinone/menaquinone biosynthesis C-methylase UbiE
MAPETLREAHRVLAPDGELVVLLTAWITGKSPLEKLAAWLFRVTDQAPTWQPIFLEQFSKAGFQPRVEKVEHQSWMLLIILAQK